MHKKNSSCGHHLLKVIVKSDLFPFYFNAAVDFGVALLVKIIKKHLGMSPIQSMFKKQTNSALFVWKIPFDFRSFNCLFLS